jgi:hypothetical protein
VSSSSSSSSISSSTADRTAVTSVLRDHREAAMAQHRRSRALLQSRVASLASQYQAHVAEKKAAKAKIKDWTKAFKAGHGGREPGTEDKMGVQHLYTDYKAWDARINGVKEEMVAAKASLEDAAR